MKNTNTKTTKLNGNGLTDNINETKDNIFPEKVESLSLSARKNNGKSKVFDIEASEKIRNLEKKVEDLTAKVAGNEGSIKMIPVVFTGIAVSIAIVAALGISKLYDYQDRYDEVQASAQSQYDKVEASTKGINKVLLKQIEFQVRTAINKFNITKSSKPEKEELNNLAELITILDNLGVKEKRFLGIKELHSILYEIVVNENLEIALEKSNIAMNEFSEDDFVSSRAKTLYALIPIVGNRNKILPKNKEEFLREAITQDNTNAGAFNSLGITLTLKGFEQMKDKGDFHTGNQSMKEAIRNFEIAGLLNPSSTGSLKYSNNKIWCNLLKFRYLINHEDLTSPKILDFLKENNYKDADSFFEDSYLNVQLYERYTDFPNPSETLAQILWLKAEYWRKLGTHSEEEVANLENLGADKFEKAITSGLFNRVETPDKALEQFKDDYLHEYIKIQRPDLRDSLYKMIKNN